MSARDLSALVRHFQVDGEYLGVTTYGSGHINDSYCVTCRDTNMYVRYILQRINRSIFKNPVALMENIQRVTSYLAARVADQPDASRLVLTLIPTRDGGAYHVDRDGEYWRLYRFIEGARTFDTIKSSQQAFQAAKAFGQFQSMLVDLPAPRLHDTIADFHHTAKRFNVLEQAIKADIAERTILVKPEIEFALAHESVASILLDAELPERVTHNDTKLNNVMFDDVTGEGICVVDLDTVMPGLALHDFGDMVRTATSSAKEDEQDLSRVTMQLSMFEALVRGYLSSAGSFLTQRERQHLISSSKVITFEQGMRFLTDYLNGDIYYKVERGEQNLDRCRTQFKLLASIEQQEEAMERVVDAAITDS